MLVHVCVCVYLCVAKFRMNYLELLSVNKSIWHAAENCLRVSFSLVTVLDYVRVHGQIRQKTYLRTYLPSEDSDQPAHLRSLIRIFTERILGSQGYKVSSCRQRRFLSDCGCVG